MKQHIFEMVHEMVGEIDDAISRFGSYTYDDKGPHEVMDVDRWVDTIRALPLNDAADTLLGIAATGGRGERLASSILGELQDWDDLFENDEVAELL